MILVILQIYIFFIYPLRAIYSWPIKKSLEKLSASFKFGYLQESPFTVYRRVWYNKSCRYIVLFIFHTPKTAETLDSCKIVDIVIIIIIIIVLHYDVIENMAQRPAKTPSTVTNVPTPPWSLSFRPFSISS